LILVIFKRLGKSPQSLCPKSHYSRNAIAEIHLFDLISAMASLQERTLAGQLEAVLADAIDVRRLPSALYLVCFAMLRPDICPCKAAMSNF